MSNNIVQFKVRYNKLRKLKNGQKERHSLQALVE